MVKETARKVLLFSWSRLFLLLWNLKVHHRVHKSLLFDTILNHMNHYTTLSLVMVLPCISSSFKWSHPLSFTDKNFVLISHFCMRAVFSSCLILNFITLPKLDEEYKLWSSLLCSALHFPLTSYLRGTNILYSSCSKHLHVRYIT
jgi:hypothetical protein